MKKPIWSALPSAMWRFLARPRKLEAFGGPLDGLKMRLPRGLKGTFVANIDPETLTITKHTYARNGRRLEYRGSVQVQGVREARE